MGTGDDVHPDQHIEQYIEVRQPGQDPCGKLADSRFSSVDLALPATASVPSYTTAGLGPVHLVSFW